MAKKTFNELKKGDTFYFIDSNHDFEIKSIVITSKLRFYRSSGLRFYYETNNLDESSIYVKGNNSKRGRYFTTIEEAEEVRNKMLNGEAFALCKKGSVLYGVSESNSEPITLEVSEVEIIEDSCYSINLVGDGYINVYGESMWNDKLSKNDLYLYDHSNLLLRSVFLNKKDALKSISESIKRKQKNATNKYIKSIENYDGKLISYTDKYDKQLHYGDVVVYAMSGGSSYPYLSFGKVCGETKTRIKVKDSINENETHNVDRTCVILMKKAEVNINSGYIFKK